MKDCAIGSAFRRTLKLCAGSVLLLVLVSTGHAADAPNSGPYIRASVVDASLKLDNFGATLRPPPNLKPVEHFDDERKTGWSLAAGWRFRHHLAIEAGYADFGERTLNSATDTQIAYHIGPTASIRTVIHGSTELETTARYVAIVGYWPLGNWEPYAKLGMLNVHTSAASKTITTLRYLFSGPPAQVTPGAISTSDSTTEALAAIGVAYTISGHYDVTLEAARVPDVGSTRTTGEGDLTSFSLGLGYRF